MLVVNNYLEKIVDSEKPQLKQNEAEQESNEDRSFSGLTVINKR
jgi:hypothetical protein